jgi:hypothetical protein
VNRNDNVIRFPGPPADNVIPLSKPWHRSPPAGPRPPGTVVGIAEVRSSQNFYGGAALRERLRRAAIKLGEVPYPIGELK